MACRVFRENTTLRWEEHGQQLEGAYSFFFSAVVRLYLERKCQVLGSSVQDRQGAPGAVPVEGSEDVWGTETFLLRGKAKRAERL